MYEKVTVNHSHRTTKSLGLCLVAGLAIAGAALRPTTGHAQSQMDMNMQSAKAFDAADAKLNTAYKKLYARLDAKSQAKLKVTQRAWIVFRDAQADFHADATVRGGSMAPMDRSETAAALTRTRTHELEEMLKDLASR